MSTPTRQSVNLAAESPMITCLFRALLVVLPLTGVASSSLAADGAYEFRVGEAAGRYASGAAMMDDLKDSKCGKPVARRMYLKDAAEEILRTVPRRGLAEFQQFLSDAKVADLRRETTILLDSMITEGIAKKGKRDACEAVEAGVKVLYFKAKNDWAKIVGTK